MDRRQFFKTSGRTGMAAILIRYLSPENAFAAPSPGHASAGSQRQAGHQLYEGMTKATGGKIYAIDFRAKDLPGWPATERRGVILRAPRVDLVYLGLELEQLRQQYFNFSIVSGDDLNKWGCRGAAPFLSPAFYVTPGQAPAYFGQPLAMLSFRSVDDYLAIKAKIPELKRYIRYGEQARVEQAPDYGSSEFVFYQGMSQDPEFSFMKDVPAQEAAADSISVQRYRTLSETYKNKIQGDLGRSDWHRFSSTYTTQAVDPMFMEPENGLSWYDSKTQTLSLLCGSQSPHEDAVAIEEFFSHAKTPPIKTIIVHCCFLGGGFGGKDSSDFPLHLAIAAMSEPDVTHRIVHSRPEQFQGGLKRHASRTDLEIALNKSGKFQYLYSDIRLDGGGQNNYSFAVQSVGARNAAGGYHFPRSVIDSVAYASSSVPAGSMRGFGSFQSSFALECLIDRAAQALEMDPIELRLNNCIAEHGVTQTGVRLAIPTHAHKVLTAAKQANIWRNRAAAKNEFSNGDFLYGTGFAAAFKTYGKNENGCLAGVEISSSGIIKLYTPGVDMGNGSATTLSLSLAEIFGRPADEVQIGVTHHFDALNLVSSVATSEGNQAALSKNPFWTPSIVISTAASTSAYHLRHAALEAAKVIVEFGLLPAAAAVLELRAEDARLTSEDYSVDEIGLRYKDGRHVSFALLSAAAYRYGFVTGALVHAYYREYWAQAGFPLAGQSYQAKIDALSVRSGSGAYVAIPRSQVSYSPLRSLQGDANQMSTYASIISVTVSRSSGEVRIVDAENFLDCGPVIKREIVEGQMQGAFAMGIGQTLTEYLSLDQLSAGQGDWNLHFYHLPKAHDCAVGRAKFHILEPTVGDAPRGMSEVVFNPISAAIVNAVADATQHRFDCLPIRPADIKKALPR